jgi:hypothetical protein
VACARSLHVARQQRVLLMLYYPVLGRHWCAHVTPMFRRYMEVAREAGAAVERPVALGRTLNK